MNATRRSAVVGSAFGLLLLAAAGCVDQKKVFVEKPLFQEPPAAAAGFLGYADTTQGTQQTACGNCHVAHQADWKQTKHAHAWLDLQANSHKAASCEACHTVNQTGNSAASANVAWTSTKDPRYVDVQCESCHGAGQTHVQNPESASRPLASIVADTGKAGLSGCAGCHNGSHHPFVEEWRASKHGFADPDPAARDACTPCHTAQGAFKAWGVTAMYKEMNAPLGQQHAITCAVCHDPHSDKNAAQTRYSFTVASVEDNLCMKCHHKRGVPDTTTTRNSHSPEGPLLLGEAGWIPPGATFKLGDLKGTHATGGMCATCHMSTASFSVDTKGNSNIGHTFQATPCVDAKGQFIGGTCDDGQRSYKACATSGCHGSDAAARSAYAVAEQRINTLATEVYRLVALAPKTEFKAGDRYTVAEGAKFNADLAVMPGSAAHNPFELEALLTTSITAMKKQYNLTSTPGIVLTSTLQGRIK